MHPSSGPDGLLSIRIGQSRSEERISRLAGRTRLSLFLLVGGQLLMLTFSLLLAGVWLTAFLSPSKTVTITIDTANEAWPELFILGAILPVIVLSAISTLRTFSRPVGLAGRGKKGKGGEAL